MITNKTQSQAVLMVSGDSGTDGRYELSNDQGIFVGKSSNCGLQLDDENIGDIQCRIYMTDGKIWIQNWMQAPGTKLNGEEVDCDREVLPQDIVQVGSHKIKVDLVVKSSPLSWTEDTHSCEELVEDCDLSELTSDLEEDVPGFDGNEAGNCYTENYTSIDSSSDSITEPEIGTLADEQGSAELNGSFVDQLDTKDVHHTKGGVDPEIMDDDIDVFSFEEETYDRETVALLQAEIDDLRSALAQRDAEQTEEFDTRIDGPSGFNEEAPDELLLRMQALIEEANSSDERVAMLEEMLHAAEDANRCEQQERTELESWVRDIEKRISQREEEHNAELNALHERLREASDHQDRLQLQLREVADSGGFNSNKQYAQMLEELQDRNQKLKINLVASEKKCRKLENRVGSTVTNEDDSLREERVKLAQEQAKVARMRYDLSNKLAEIEQGPTSGNRSDLETDQRIRALREHLREIHDQEKQEAKEASLATRISNLWKRTEY